MIGLNKSSGISLIWQKVMLLTYFPLNLLLDFRNVISIFFEMLKYATSVAIDVQTHTSVFIIMNLIIIDT